MLEVGRDGEGEQFFIGKLFSEKVFEVKAEFLAGELAGGAFIILADEFQAVRLGASKTFDGEGETLAGMIGDGQNAAGEIVLIGPDMEQRFFRGAANFPGKMDTGSEAAAVFLERARSADLGERI